MAGSLRPLSLPSWNFDGGGSLVLRTPHFISHKIIPMSTQRATCWSITINNPTPQDEEYIALARQKGWTIDGQRERGAQGTEHYQLVARTPQVRFSQVKKAFPRAHIEVARNAPALTAYVHKTDTRVSELPTGQELYPSLSKFWDLIFEDLVACGIDPRSVHGYSERSACAYLDQAVDHIIRKGYHVETLAVNPQTRSAFAKFSSALFWRWETRRQTDRQTAENNVAPIDHNHAVSPPLSEEEEDDSSQGSWSSDASPF